MGMIHTEKTPPTAMNINFRVVITRSLQLFTTEAIAKRQRLKRQKPSGIGQAPNLCFPSARMTSKASLAGGDASVSRGDIACHAPR